MLVNLLLWVTSIVLNEHMQMKLQRVTKNNKENEGYSLFRDTLHRKEFSRMFLELLPEFLTLPTLPKYTSVCFLSVTHCLVTMG